jgi:hypothetical protein
MPGCQLIRAATGGYLNPDMSERRRLRVSPRDHERNSCAISAAVASVYTLTEGTMNTLISGNLDTTGR